MYFLEKAKGVAMESLSITPSTQPMVSAPIESSSNTTKVETKNIKSTEVEGKVQNQENSQQKEHKTDSAEVSKEFNEISDSLNLDVKFAYNEKIDEVYINVTDKNTGKVIRKLPTEEAMKIKESMKDLVGVLFDKKG
jgi:flagellar protein FlaG